MGVMDYMQVYRATATITPTLITTGMNRVVIHGVKINCATDGTWVVAFGATSVFEHFTVAAVGVLGGDLHIIPGGGVTGAAGVNPTLTLPAAGVMMIYFRVV